MSNQSSLAGIYTDFQGLGELRAGVKRQDKEASREAAQQFESLFIQTMLKSMRQATDGDSLTGSDQMNMYRDMMDQQLSIDLAKRGGIGIAAVIQRQLGSFEDNENKPSNKSTEKTAHAGFPYSRHSLALANRLWNGISPSSQAIIQPANAKWKTHEDFIQTLKPAAHAAAAKLGTQPEAILAVAALETGWGKHVMPAQNGNSSFNLFGIKASKGWRQGKVMATTLEFENGAMQKRREPFRTYNNPAESVADFADFIQRNPRYQSALNNAGNPEKFLQEIHKAGYATDPDYSKKVVSVMRQIQAMTQDSVTVADNSI